MASTTGLSMEDVRTALAAANANRPRRGVQRGALLVAERDRPAHDCGAEYAPLVVRYREARPSAWATSSRVTDSVRTSRAGGASEWQAAIIIIIFQPGANIIETVDRVRALLPQFQASIPPTIKLSVVIDATRTIRASVRDVQITLVISILLVILVVFAFLRSVRSTLIPTVAVPVSLIGTFGVMYLLGYSLDNLSLMALTVATGFVVDDAIVVVENVTRHLEEGHAPFEAALQGAKEIGFTVMSISVSLVAVFIPILLMGGIVGRLLREFAVTLSIAIAVSLVVSLTTTPMMCARLLKGKEREQHGRLYRASERAFQAVLHAYERSLTVVLRHQPLTLAVTLLTMAATVLLYARVPKGFFPQQDTGRSTDRSRPTRTRRSRPCRRSSDAFVGTVMADRSRARRQASSAAGRPTPAGCS
jgi:multidrug efflux pump